MSIQRRARQQYDCLAVKGAALEVHLPADGVVAAAFVADLGKSRRQLSADHFRACNYTNWAGLAEGVAIRIHNRGWGTSAAPGTVVPMAAPAGPATERSARTSARVCWSNSSRSMLSVVSQAL
jgi:hypothetical protein